MTESNDRIATFRSEIDDLKLKTGRVDHERLGTLVGVVLMVAGIVVALVAYFSSTGQSDARDQNDLIILSLAAVAVTVAGAAVFLRYSLARFLRFWLLRQLYEGQANVERLVTELEHRDAH